MPTRLDNFQVHREDMNERIIEFDHNGLKRFFNLHTAAYREGALDDKTKELRGSIVIPHLKHPVETIDLLRFEDES